MQNKCTCQYEGAKRFITESGLIHNRKCPCGKTKRNDQQSRKNSTKLSPSWSAGVDRASGVVNEKICSAATSSRGATCRCDGTSITRSACVPGAISTGGTRTQLKRQSSRKRCLEMKNITS